RPRRGLDSGRGSNGGLAGHDRAPDRRLVRWEFEDLVVHLNIGFRGVDGEVNPSRSALAARLDREGDPDAGDLAVAAVVSLGDLLGAANVPHHRSLDLQEVLGIEVDVEDVPVL